MGVWIEIELTNTIKLMQMRRTPRWVRGLKYHRYCLFLFLTLSHPTMGAWIEIKTEVNELINGITSHPTMGAWIEMTDHSAQPQF